MRYFIQHPAGIGDLLETALPQFVPNCTILYADDSSTMFDSSLPVNSVEQVPFAKNVFIVFTSTPRGNLDRGIIELSHRVEQLGSIKFSGQVKSFRTMFQIDGELSPVDRRSKQALENALIRKTGGRVEARGMCQEYWVIGRRDMAELLFCARLARRKRPAKIPGALSYELSSMLVAASSPLATDVFMDPFAGSGSLISARLAAPARRIIYSDTDVSLRRRLPRELTQEKRVEFLAKDALRLTGLADNSVDVIVTDPPWGEHGEIGMPYETFAADFVASFNRVLHPSRGRFVILTSRRTESVVSDSLAVVDFKVFARHRILVNGHPATVHIGGR